MKRVVDRTTGRAGTACDVRRVETSLRECDTCHRAYGYDGTHESSQAPGLSCCERCYGQEVVRDA